MSNIVINKSVDVVELHSNTDLTLESNTQIKFSTHNILINYIPFNEYIHKVVFNTDITTITLSDSSSVHSWENAVDIDTITNKINLTDNTSELIVDELHCSGISAATHSYVNNKYHYINLSATDNIYIKNNTNSSNIVYNKIDDVMYSFSNYIYKIVNSPVSHTIDSLSPESITINSINRTDISSLGSYIGKRIVTSNISTSNVFVHPGNEPILEFDSKTAVNFFTNVYSNPGDVDAGLKIHFGDITLDELVKSQLDERGQISFTGDMSSGQNIGMRLTSFINNPGALYDIFVYNITFNIYLQDVFIESFTETDINTLVSIPSLDTHTITNINSATSPLSGDIIFTNLSAGKFYTIVATVTNTRTNTSVNNIIVQPSYIPTIKNVVIISVTVLNEYNISITFRGHFTQVEEWTPATFKLVSFHVGIGVLGDTGYIEDDDGSGNLSIDPNNLEQNLSLVAPVTINGLPILSITATMNDELSLIPQTYTTNTLSVSIISKHDDIVGSTFRMSTSGLLTPFTFSAPSAPPTFIVNIETSSSRFNWTSSTNIRIRDIYYNIYRDGFQSGNTRLNTSDLINVNNTNSYNNVIRSTNYSGDNISFGGIYPDTYKIKAYNVYGLFSGPNQFVITHPVITKPTIAFKGSSDKKLIVSYSVSNNNGSYTVTSSESGFSGGGTNSTSLITRQKNFGNYSAWVEIQDSYNLSVRSVLSDWLTIHQPTITVSNLTYDNSPRIYRATVSINTLNAFNVNSLSSISHASLTELTPIDTDNSSQIRFRLNDTSDSVSIINASVHISASDGYGFSSQAIRKDITIQRPNITIGSLTYLNSSIRKFKAPISSDNAIFSLSAVAGLNCTIDSSSGITQVVIQVSNNSSTFNTTFNVKLVNTLGFSSTNTSSGVRSIAVSFPSVDNTISHVSGSTRQFKHNIDSGVTYSWSTGETTKTVNLNNDAYPSLTCTCTQTNDQGFSIVLLESSITIIIPTITVYSFLIDNQVNSYSYNFQASTSIGASVTTLTLGVSRNEFTYTLPVIDSEFDPLNTTGSRNCAFDGAVTYYLFGNIVDEYGFSNNGMVYLNAYFYARKHPTRIIDLTYNKVYDIVTRKHKISFNLTNVGADGIPNESYTIRAYYSHTTIITNYVPFIHNHSFYDNIEAGIYFGVFIPNSDLVFNFRLVKVYATYSLILSESISGIIFEAIPPSLPRVTTTSSIRYNTITIAYNLGDNGNPIETISSATLYYGTDSMVLGSTETLIKDIPNYSIIIPSLNPNTIYYFKIEKFYPTYGQIESSIFNQRTPQLPTPISGITYTLSLNSNNKTLVAFNWTQIGTNGNPIVPYNHIRAYYSSSQFAISSLPATYETIILGRPMSSQFDKGIIYFRLVKIYSSMYDPIVSDLIQLTTPRLVPTNPPTPTLISTSTTFDTIVINWNNASLNSGHGDPNNSSSVKFFVYYRIINGTYPLIENTFFAGKSISYINGLSGINKVELSNSASSISFRPLDSYTEYWFRIFKVYTFYDFTYSDYLRERTNKILPTSQDLTYIASETTASSITIYWTDLGTDGNPIKTPNYVKIYYSENYNLAIIDSSTESLANVFTYTITELDKTIYKFKSLVGLRKINHIYYFKIVKYYNTPPFMDLYVYKPNSLSVRTLKLFPTPPSRPTITDITSSSFKVSWTNLNSNGDDGTGNPITIIDLKVKFVIATNLINSTASSTALSEYTLNIDSAERIDDNNITFDIISVLGMGLIGPYTSSVSIYKTCSGFLTGGSYDIYTSQSVTVDIIAPIPPPVPIYSRLGTNQARISWAPGSVLDAHGNALNTYLYVTRPGYSSDSLIRTALDIYIPDNTLYITKIYFMNKYEFNDTTIKSDELHIKTPIFPYIESVISPLYGTLLLRFYLGNTGSSSQAATYSLIYRRSDNWFSFVTQIILGQYQKVINGLLPNNNYTFHIQANYGPIFNTYSSVPIVGSPLNRHILNTPNWDVLAGNLLIYRLRIKDSDEYFGYDESKNEFTKVSYTITEDGKNINKFGIIVIEKRSGKLDYRVYIRNGRFANEDDLKHELLDHGGEYQGVLEFQEYKTPYFNRQFLLGAVTSTSYNEVNKYYVQIYQILSLESFEEGLSYNTSESRYDCSNTNADIFILERDSPNYYAQSSGDPQSKSYIL